MDFCLIKGYLIKEYFPAVICVIPIAILSSIIPLDNPVYMYR